MEAREDLALEEPVRELGLTDGFLEPAATDFFLPFFFGVSEYPRASGVIKFIKLPNRSRVSLVSGADSTGERNPGELFPALPE
ncbi:hypothetical protein AGDE_13165 [Angomonas deanei]|nr:hypothetical protein AGDE_13165 [Angomonas deanei]|eukprot:EPY22686.1 hypothetical protein AGDE_13165 [Angomonas deanei]